MLCIAASPARWPVLAVGAMNDSVDLGAASAAPSTELTADAAPVDAEADAVQLAKESHESRYLKRKSLLHLNWRPFCGVERTSSVAQSQPPWSRAGTKAAFVQQNDSATRSERDLDELVL